MTSTTSFGSSYKLIFKMASNSVVENAVSLFSFAEYQDRNDWSVV